MKNYLYKFLAIALCSIMMSGCNKYLDVQPKGVTLLTTTSNYDQWLNDPALDLGVSPPICYLDLLADNVDDPGIPNPPTAFSDLMYTWAQQFSTDLTTSPVPWGTHYANINKFNTVLLGIDNATGGTQDQIKSLRAEALLGRALEYFYLVNEYGKEYDSTTAGSDPAVPFVTSNDVSQTVPPRSTIAQIDSAIINDINTALPNLPADNSGNRFRGSIAAGYSVLARIYFYSGDYADAEKNAQLALQTTSAVMIDYNGTIPAAAAFSVQPDVIYGRIVVGEMVPALDFMRSFASNDLRVHLLYYSADYYTFVVRGGTYYYPGIVTPYFIYTNTGTSVQEMKLIIAESAARAGDLSTALQQLGDVQKARFASASYVPYQSSSKDSVLAQVLTERNHELPFGGLRWLDMRRLDKENRMDTVYRYDAKNNIIATLPPHSAGYTLQIPVQVLQFNPDMPQNP